MPTIAIILIIVALALGLVIGFYCGVFFIKRENKVLSNQIRLLESFSKHWANAATNQNLLSQQIATQQNSNMTTTLQALSHIIGAAQPRPVDESVRDSAAIADLINRTKAISDSNEFEE